MKVFIFIFIHLSLYLSLDFIFIHFHSAEAHVAASIAFPLSIMFENFFRSKFLPPIWKLAHVKPVYKSGDSSLTKNYRPISLTCVLSKIMESIIKDQISDFLFEKGLLSRHQHGFLSGRSTCT